MKSRHQPRTWDSSHNRTIGSIAQTTTVGLLVISYIIKSPTFRWTLHRATSVILLIFAFISSRRSAGLWIDLFGLVMLLGLEGVRSYILFYSIYSIHLVLHIDNTSDL